MLRRGGIPRGCADGSLRPRQHRRAARAAMGGADAAVLQRGRPRQGGCARVWDGGAFCCGVRPAHGQGGAALRPAARVFPRQSGPRRSAAAGAVRAGAPRGRAGILGAPVPRAGLHPRPVRTARRCAARRRGGGELLRPGRGERGRVALCGRARSAGIRRLRQPPRAGRIAERAGRAGAAVHGG